LGTFVVCTVFRTPALLANMAATVDEISNGRLTLGLAALVTLHLSIRHLNLALRTARR
jgi:hypothetical protein